MGGNESAGYPGVIAARYDLDERPTDLGMDDESRSLNVNLRVWNTTTLKWERKQAASTEVVMQTDLMEQLLAQIKIMNKHLSILSGENLEGEEIP
jgi:hypothetical protein